MAASAKKKKKKKQPTEYALSTCVVRVTQDLKDHLTGQAKYGESVDTVLRRLLNLEPWNPSSNGKGKKSSGR